MDASKDAFVTREEKLNFLYLHIEKISDFRSGQSTFPVEFPLRVLKFGKCKGAFAGNMPCPAYFQYQEV